MGSGTYKETTDQSMNLPEDSPNTVERFVQWLYRRDWELASHTIDNESTGRCYMQLAELYVFSDKYDVAGLHNRIIDKLFEMQPKATIAPPESHIGYIYDNTASGSSFRQLLVAYEVTHGGKAWYLQEDASEVMADTPEFAADVAVAFARLSLKKYTSPFNNPKSELYRSTRPESKTKKSGKANDILPNGIEGEKERKIEEG